MSKLAIIVPYYKPQFLRDALLSITAQQNQDFHVYIGDDNSPHDPAGILKDVFGDELDNKVTYKRFKDNLGAVSLTRQWGRCIDLAHEPYIWLFSDDDLMPADAVERFYSFMGQHPDAGLLRFNIDRIDDKGAIIGNAPRHPMHETAEGFLKRRLQGICISSACEYIFKKDTYIQQGGFVDLPLAWAADDATWINFGKSSGIYTIPGNPVCWRFGSFNISADTSNYKEKIKASLMFIKLTRANYPIDVDLQLHWLFAQLGLLRRSAKVVLYFFYELFYSRMFSFNRILLFTGNKLVKKLFSNKPGPAAL